MPESAWALSGASWLLGLAPIRAGLFIQERPQREILGAGASSVKKLADVRICGAPAG